VTNPNPKTGEFQDRMDPVLRLYRSCQLMLPINMNVSSGQANGSQVSLEKVVLKEGVVPQEHQSPAYFDQWFLCW
jgi:hypothetical protein